MPYPSDRERDPPWVIRTYAGHSSARRSNELYRRNIAKGQTGLSAAFDLRTQAGYDPDDELATGEVGKVGVPVSHVGDMRALFDGIPMAEANTSVDSIVAASVADGLRAAGAQDVPVIVGGIIPTADAATLRERGVAAVFTPKDYQLTEMMDEIVTLVLAAHS